MSPYRENPAMEAPIAPTQERSRPPRCSFGTHVPVIDAINMCVACEKCGCSLRHNYEPFGDELFEARRQFEREYLGGYYQNDSTVSGNGTLRQDYWYLWDDSGRDDLVWNPDRRVLLVVAVAAVLLLVLFIRRVIWV